MKLLNRLYLYNLVISYNLFNNFKYSLIGTSFISTVYYIYLWLEYIHVPIFSFMQMFSYGTLPSAQILSISCFTVYGITFIRYDQSQNIVYLPLDIFSSIGRLDIFPTILAAKHVYLAWSLIVAFCITSEWSTDIPSLHTPGELITVISPSTLLFSQFTFLRAGWDLIIHSILTSLS